VRWKVRRHLSDEFIIALLVALVYPVITTILSAIFEEQFVNTLAYLWLLAILAIVILAAFYIHSYNKRPVAAKFRNEDNALPKIVEMISHTKNNLRVLSKVGTTVFFASKEYSDLLEKGKKIHVLIVNPNDRILIKTMDKLYVKGTGKGHKWHDLLFKISDRIEALYSEDHLIDKSQYEKLRVLLDPNIAKGYRNLIVASLEMWKLTWSRANERLQSEGKHLSPDSLDLRVYGNSVLPDLKAWIFDDDACLIGHYGEVSLGRENPIDFYNSHRNRGSEGHKIKDYKDSQSWEIQNIIDIWNFYFESSKKINNSDLAEDMKENRD
jgi:hypothetical protein